jgi:hypothetical protein
MKADEYVVLLSITTELVLQAPDNKGRVRPAVKFEGCVLYAILETQQ